MDNYSFYIIVGGLIVLAISLWIIYEIIKAATFGKKIFEEQEMQTLLLIEIARKLGVEEEKIEEIAYEDEAETEEFKP